MTQYLNSDNISEFLAWSVTINALILWGLVLHYAYTQAVPRQNYAIIFLIFILLIYSADELVKDINNNDWLRGALLITSTILAIIPLVYLYLNVQVLYTSRVGYAFTYEYLLAFSLTLSIIYYTWRSFGRGFLAILLFAIFYGLFGPYFPGITAHSGISPTRMMLILVLEIEGFLGSLLRLVAAWVALFLLYAGLMQGYGLFDLLMRTAAKSRKYITSGVAQSAVLGSVAIGSIMGSQTANTGMTGSFTIPLMQENGMKGTTAGGIESVASTLGQVLPPIMGASAFIMPSLIVGITYWDVVVAGAIPAFIILTSVVIAVHYAGVRQLDSNVMDDLVEGTLTRREKIVELLRFGVPFVILLWALGIQQYTVMTSGLYASVSMILVGILSPFIGSIYNLLHNGESVVADHKEEILTDSVGLVLNFGEKIDKKLRIVKGSPVFVLTLQIQKSIQGARKGAIILAPITIIIVAINGIVDIIQVTGVANLIALSIYQLSGGILLVATILAMAISLLLGLGMPTIASYSLVAILIAPGLITQFGIPELSAHYVVFYGAILAGITPPIATCCAVAAGISRSSFLGTCYESVKIAAPLFIVPISFTYYPEIVSGSFSLDVIVPTLLILTGAITLTYALNAEIPYNRLPTYAFRIAYAVLGVSLIIYPNTNIKLYIIAVIGIVTIFKIVIENRIANTSTSTS